MGDGELLLPFTGALQLILILSKLTEIISWNWFLVFIPTWIAIAIGLIIVIISIIIVSIDNPKKS